MTFSMGVTFFENFAIFGLKWPNFGKNRKKCEVWDLRDISIGIFFYIFEIFGHKWPTFGRRQKKISNLDSHQKLNVFSYDNGTPFFWPNLVENLSRFCMLFFRCKNDFFEENLQNIFFNSFSRLVLQIIIYKLVLWIIKYHCEVNYQIMKNML